MHTGPVDDQNICTVDGCSPISGPFHTPIAGCDEQTYYATPADAQTIAAGRAAGEVVQLHRAEAGGSVQASAIVCVIDGQGAT